MLKKRVEFLKTYKGQVVVGRYYKVYYTANDKAFNRIGVTAPKTMGTAVIRNKYKRWVKEVFKDYKNKGSEKFKDVHIAFLVKNKKEEFKKKEWINFKTEINQKLNEILK